MNICLYKLKASLHFSFIPQQGNVEHISISSDAKNLVTSDFKGKHLQVWKCDLNSGSLCRGPTLPIRHPPLVYVKFTLWHDEQ